MKGWRRRGNQQEDRSLGRARRRALASSAAVAAEVHLAVAGVAKELATCKVAGRGRSSARVVEQTAAEAEAKVRGTAAAAVEEGPKRTCWKVAKGVIPYPVDAVEG